MELVGLFLRRSVHGYLSDTMKNYYGSVGIKHASIAAKA